MLLQNLSRGLIVLEYAESHGFTPPSNRSFLRIGICELSANFLLLVQNHDVLCKFSKRWARKGNLCITRFNFKS